MKVERQTVDLSEYPGLVVIYLGMRVNVLRAVKNLVGFGPRISDSAAAKPDGLLFGEQIIYSSFPPHFGMRQYWRDLDSLERSARSEPHMLWWKQFLRDSGSAGFWHETYFMRGGMEAIYDDIPKPIGFGVFAPIDAARGPMSSARTHLVEGGRETKPPALPGERSLF
jgi:hypothetical protein